jgi:hypothetical protein
MQVVTIGGTASATIPRARSFALPCVHSTARKPIDEVMRQKIRASLADPHADVSAEEVFARLRAYREDQLKADPDDA